MSYIYNDCFIILLYKKLDCRGVTRMQEYNPPIFALDIGTRSIVGILAYSEGDKLTVADCEVYEHQERSMLDGQIHDVIKVSEVIGRIKKALEDRNCTQLTHASVAAAGRSLKTIRTKIFRSIKDQPFSSRDEVAAFELEAVQQAQHILMKENEGIDKTRFHCVGYSVVEYKIDDSSIGSIIDQYGEIASIDVIATFLPRVVVDSLQAALARADLEISALTLEPIAAINVLIPSTMRKLNIALVDIGAGTSDIALTADGTITAYAMVPAAGDKITEVISQKYLLDFNVAEKVKRSLHEEQVFYEDVLGFSYEKSNKEIITEIRENVEILAKQIAEKILEFNKQSPQAVMLIGGGSMTPLLTDMLAMHLNLPKERVAVRGAQAIQNIIGEHEILKGPEAVTPVGIAMSAVSNHIDFINIFVNRKKVRVFDLKKLTVGDALIAAGVDMNRLHGKPGMALSAEVNGNLRIIRGEHGSPARILINNEPATLESPIKESDEIITENGVDGENAIGQIIDILTAEEQAPFPIYFNKSLVELPILIYRNGKPAEASEQLQDRDQIIVHPPSTVKECLTACGVTDLDFSDAEITIYINGQAKTLPNGTRSICINNEPASLYTRINPNDAIDIITTQQQNSSIREVLDSKLLYNYEVTVKVNDKKITLINPGFKILLNGQPVNIDNTLNDQDSIEFTFKNHLNIIFNDIFKYVDIMSKKPESASRLSMTLNNQPATYDVPLNNGDIIELEWK
jgi:cell division protein FtsA